MIECQILLKKEQNYKLCGKKHYSNLFSSYYWQKIEYFEYMIII